MFWADWNACSHRKTKSPSVSSSLNKHDVQELHFCPLCFPLRHLCCVFWQIFLSSLLHLFGCIPHKEICTRLGWGLFDNNVVTPLGYWYNIPSILLHDWKLTHPIMAAEAFAVLTAIWQHRDLLIDTEAAASAMIKGDSRLPVVGTMAFPSQSHWLCCENNSFQNLLTIDQSDQLEYVRRLVPHLSVRCFGPIVRESEHCFLSLLFCVCGSKFRHITLSLSVSRSLATMFQILLHYRAQLRIESLFSLCLGTFSPSCVKRVNYKRLFVGNFIDFVDPSRHGLLSYYYLQYRHKYL